MASVELSRRSCHYRNVSRSARQLSLCNRTAPASSPGVEPVARRHWGSQPRPFPYPARCEGSALLPPRLRCDDGLSARGARRVGGFTVSPGRSALAVAHIRESAQLCQPVPSSAAPNVARAQVHSVQPQGAMNLIKPVIWIMVIVAVTFSLTGCTTARMAAEQQTPAPAGSSSQDQPSVNIPAGLVAADLASKVPECITVTDDPTETASMASVSGVVTAAGCTTSVGQLEFLTYATARG